MRPDHLMHTTERIPTLFAAVALAAIASIPAFYPVYAEPVLEEPVPTAQPTAIPPTQYPSIPLVGATPCPPDKELFVENTRTFPENVSHFFRCGVVNAACWVARMPPVCYTPASKLTARCVPRLSP